MGGSATVEQNGARKRGRPRSGAAPDPRLIEHIALRSFAVAGYAATSIRDVALTANVDPALISRRYGSKMELWLATVDAVAARLDAVYDLMRRDMEGDGGFAERFRAVLRRFVSFNCAMPELARFFFNETQHPGERRDYIIRKIWRPYLTVMQALFSEARRRGVSRLSDPEMSAVSLLGLVVMPQLAAFALDQPGSGETDLVDRIMMSVDNIMMPLPGPGTPCRDR